MSIKQKLLSGEISYKEACVDYYIELTKEDFDFIVEKSPSTAAYYLSHRLSEENMSYLANHYPQYLKEVFK